MTYSVKQKLGAIIYDVPRLVWSMRPSAKHPWVFMRNRDERLTPVPGGLSPVGVACEWQWTSELHVAKVFPRLGRQLMKRTLKDWPIELLDQPAIQKTNKLPALSFVIGHRGKERFPHLLATLQSIAAQRDAAFECIVVEQSMNPEIRDQLPSWVRYVHTPLPYPDMPYSRAWAFNCGARTADAEALVLHDNDMLVPVDYAKEIISRLEAGFEVVNLKRFIFFLSNAHSAAVLNATEHLEQRPPEVVMQNAEAGGSIAITRETYFALGGLDEAFVGWGGEDNEFWQRAATRRVWPYGYLPIVHLWHRAQTDKFNQARTTAELLAMRSAISPEERIAELRLREFGMFAQTEQALQS